MPVIFKSLFFAPYSPEKPSKPVSEWAKETKRSREKTYKKLGRVVRTKKDFNRKIGKAILKAADTCFMRGKDITLEEVKEKTRDSVSRRAPKKYFRGRKIGYQKKIFNKKIEHGKEWYAESLMEYERPLKGYKTGRGKMRKGLPSLGMMALTADKELLKYLKKDEDKIEGNLVCAVKPEKLIGFRKLLRNKLVSAGSWIIKTNYSEKIIKIWNERINKLLNEYRADGIAPFAPAGPSYVNFGVVETKPQITQITPIDPVNPDEKIKRLILDIQVARE